MGGQGNPLKLKAFCPFSYKKWPKVKRFKWNVPRGLRHTALRSHARPAARSAHSWIRHCSTFPNEFSSSSIGLIVRRCLRRRALPYLVDYCTYVRRWRRQSSASTGVHTFLYLCYVFSAAVVRQSVFVQLSGDAAAAKCLKTLHILPKLITVTVIVIEK